MDLRPGMTADLGLRLAVSDCSCSALTSESPLSEVRGVCDKDSATSRDVGESLEEATGDVAGFKVAWVDSTLLGGEVGDGALGTKDFGPLASGLEVNWAEIVAG